MAQSCTFRDLGIFVVLFMILFIYLHLRMNVLNPENKDTIQNHAIKLYSKIKIKKGKTLEKIWKAICKGV